MKKQSLSLFRRGGLANKLFGLAKRRRARSAVREARSSAFRFESLEDRMMLDGAAATSLPTYNPNSDFHIHFDLWLWANGQRIAIPAHVGPGLGAVMRLCTEPLPLPGRKAVCSARCPTTPHSS